MSPMVYGGPSNYITGYPTDDDTDIDFGSTLWLGQTFPLTHIYALYLAPIKIWAQDPGFPYRFSLYRTDVQGKPTGLPFFTTYLLATGEATSPPGKWRRLPIPLFLTLSPGTYALVFSRPTAPLPTSTKARADTSLPAYPQGKAWVSPDSGATWTELPNTTLLFQVWGYTPPPYPPPPSTIGNWAPLDMLPSPLPTGFKVELTTDRTCHLYLRWTSIEPTKHPAYRLQRGLRLMSGLRYSFVAFLEIEQLELGDTLLHTFELNNWPLHQTRWFYFIGTVITQEMPSSSPVFHLHRA